MNKLKKTLVYALPYIFFTPLLVNAQASNFSYLTGFVANLRNLIAALIPVVVAIGLLVFIWGMVVFIMNSGNEQARSEGKQKMVWGIIILFVMVSVWGFVNLLITLTNITGGNHGLSAPTIL